MSNRLKYEASPYLIQHAENPVDWYPWCDEAFKKAKAEDKPIFLSVGYSTCHWCHVMAHESFEDEITANILNEHFVSIKVDREQRPDIDSVYMSVCQALTGSGGWPMSVFMTWDKKPFFAGTYFPPRSRHGVTSFPDLLNAIAHSWKNDREELLSSAHRITAHLINMQANDTHSTDSDIIIKAVQMFSRSFDREHGGFGSAPKFPTPHNLWFLMLYYKKTGDENALTQVEKTLLSMRKGGIFDHIGGGFSRYSTDKYFLAPHFEKMLYDNALLIIAYSAAYSLTKKSIYLDTAEKTAEYILREMTSPKGGFYSAQDADSDGVEGKYYTFTKAEITELLGADRGEAFSNVFDITDKGNFEGVNIPNLLKSDNLDNSFEHELRKLYDYRKKRTKLHLDHKISVSQNSMMIAALSMLYRVTGSEKYLNAAVNAYGFIMDAMLDGTQLYTVFCDNALTRHTFLDDYAYFSAALIELYNSTMDTAYLKKAEEMAKAAQDKFYDGQRGGYYMSPSDSYELFMNPKETYDGAVPSGNSVMAYVLVRLFQLTEKEEYEKSAKKQLSYMSGNAQSYPAGHTMFLIAKLLYENPPAHILAVLKEPADLAELKAKLPFLGNVCIVPESAEHPCINNKTTYHICKDNVCLLPTNELVQV